MPFDFCGIDEKLERADENIRNLNREISDFLKERPDGGFSKDKNKAADQFVEFYAGRGVPPRFRVLTGEIAHHLRSCLDHIAWLLSDKTLVKRERDIAFPIFVGEMTEQKLATYNGMVKGITSAAALKIIREVQPCNTGKNLDDSLSIVHEMDRVDKHHNLVLVVTRFDGNMFIPLDLFRSFVFSAHQMNEETFADHCAQTAEMKFSPQVAFEEFGQRKNQPVVTSLAQLLGDVRAVVGRFKSEVC